MMIPMLQQEMQISANESSRVEHFSHIARRGIYVQNDMASQ